MTAYTAENARADLNVLAIAAGSDTDREAADRLSAYLTMLERRVDAAERVCFAAVEVSAPTVKGDLMPARQKRFMQVLAEWRAGRE